MIKEFWNDHVGKLKIINLIKLTKNLRKYINEYNKKKVKSLLWSEEILINK